jgi:TonB-linked SusC/RagA family outer membrane protein
MPKKFTLNAYPVSNNRCFKISQVLRLSCLILLISLKASAYGYTQRINIQAKNASLEDVLTDIRKQSAYNILYNIEALKGTKPITINLKKASLEDALTAIFKGQSLSYKIIDNNIIVSFNKTTVQEQIIITGQVSDKSGPLPGVSVLVKGSQKGVSTNTDGKYTISADKGAVLVFSSIGYGTKEVTVGNETVINVVLTAALSDLNEVVVVGYGTARKRDLTGSVSSIKASEINAVPTTNVIQSLAGRASGVYVSQNTGAPGAAISVRIRGTNSIQGSNEPLYVIDGFPSSAGPTLLNNADIESVEILKDASATAIYGSRGANGVVLITTKKGKAGKVKVDYDGYYGVQTIRKKLELMNATEYAMFYNEQAANDKVSPHFTQDQINSFGNGTNWQDVIFRRAPMRNNSVTVSGGSEKTRFSIAASNFDQAGIVIGSDYLRNSLRLNLNSDIGKMFKFDISAVLTRVNEEKKNLDRGNRGGSLMSAALSGYPTVPLYNPDGTYTKLAEAYTWGSNVIINPLNFLYQYKDLTRSNRILTNTSLSFQPIKGLIFKTLAGIENTDDRNDTYRTTKFVNSTGFASVSTPSITSLLSENTVNYQKTLGKHTFSALAGFTYQDYVSTGLSASGNGFISDNQETFDIGAAATQGVPATYYSKWALLSYLSRINYNYNDKLLATVSFRADGSSRYSENNKWGYFPSVALAYRLSQESFIKKYEFISDLKLRVGYGATGNTAINPYYTLNQLSSGQVVFGDALTTSYAPGTRLAGPLKWETTAQTDVGLDLGILNNRLTFTLDLYIKNTRDLLNNVSLPASLGYAYTVQNIGKIQNKGIDFSVNADVLNKELKWQLSGNISVNRNKVIKLSNGSDILGETIGAALIDNVNILREGYPLGSFYGYVEKGYDQNGLIAYEDFNSNGIRDAGDKRIIGNPNSKFTYGLNSNMSYKNFDFSVFVQGVQGNDIYNLSAQGQNYDYGQGLNMLKEVYLNHWTPSNTNAKYPVIKTLSQAQMSNRFIEDGSFLRLKNIQLGYNLPIEKWKIGWLSKGQVYVSGQNLITLTKYSWYDPEINSYGSSNSIVQGVDHYAYPTSKTLTFGVRASF